MFYSITYYVFYTSSIIVQFYTALYIVKQVSNSSKWIIKMVA